MRRSMVIRGVRLTGESMIFEMVEDLLVRVIYA